MPHRIKHIILGFVLILCCMQQRVLAHEVRPAYLEIKQLSDTSYSVFWKVPRIGDAFMIIRPVFPPSFQLEEASVPTVMMGAMLFQYKLHGPKPLAGQKVTIEHLNKTYIDALVNVEYRNGEKVSLILRGNSPDAVLPVQASKWSVIKTYTSLGIEHIWTGIDHLLFVLALLLITRTISKTVKTVTAFTVAHSITLSLAALGLVHIPTPPVEATIALSIVFVAMEIVKLERGQQTLTSRKPWLVAFSFGLLHGLGFAGALASIGLPQTEIPLALAFFNIGVELGQLGFVLLVSGIIAVLQKRIHQWPVWTRLVPAYSIGSLAVFWMIERLVAFGG